MKSMHGCIIAGIVGCLSASGAHAASYSNPLGQTPFNLTLDTGSAAWVGASSNLNSSSASSSWEGTSTSTGPIQTVIVDPKPGVKGSYDIFYETFSTPHHYESSSQSININYSASLAAPIDVPQTYILSGSIEKQAAATLLGSGYTSLNFGMGMNINFVDPYTPGTADGTLTFRLGSAPGVWAYQFSTNFKTDPGYVSLSNNQYLNLNDFSFFEAEYEITGTSGVQFGIDNLNLGISGGLSTYSSTPTGPATVIDKTTLYHAEIPALPVTVPVPAAVWLLGSGLIGMVGIARRQREGGAC